MKRLICTAFLTLLPVSMAFAQDGGTLTDTLLRILLNVLPALIIFAVFYFLFLRVIKRSPSQKRFTDHIDRIEKQNDRIIELLEKLAEKK